MVELIRCEMQAIANPKDAFVLQRFFKTSHGQYGYGDIFVGIRVPTLRQISRKYAKLSLGGIEMLLHSKIHEERMVAILILIQQQQQQAQMAQKDAKCTDKIVKFYLKNIEHVNNWDLVDVSAPKILGAYLLDNRQERSILYRLSSSNNLWQRRISIVSTLAFIRKNEFDDALKISAILLSDSHDLIHKAVGWMLREVGKRDAAIEESFLNQHYKNMPRTALRYAIEHFSRDKRLAYQVQMRKPDSS
jgi:3-methyladenine DNA glycosylase AlkD